MEDFRQRFDGPGLARAGWPEEKEDSCRPVRWIQVCLVHVDVRHDLPQRVRLSAHLLREQLRELAWRHRGHIELTRPPVHDVHLPRAIIVGERVSVARERMAEVRRLIIRKRWRGHGVCAITILLAAFRTGRRLGKVTSVGKSFPSTRRPACGRYCQPPRRRS